MSRTIANASGSTFSPWMTETVPTFDDDLPELSRPDCCIVGAGIAGLSTALALVRQGADVLVLDHGPIGGGQTARTSAHLASALDDRFYELARHFGPDGARLAAASHAAAIDAIEANVRELAIACDFRRVDGYLWTPSRLVNGERRELEREHDAARDAGLVCQHIDRAPLPFDTGPCLRFANQAEFHPLAYLRGLAQAIVALGGRICTGRRVLAIRGGDPIEIDIAGGHTVRAATAIDATNSSITSRFDLPLRDAAYRTYCVALAVPHGYVPHALYWDTIDPYHYVRVARFEDERDLLIVGGEDHRVGQGDAESAWSHLETWSRAHFPATQDIVARWSGQILEPADGLAYIGALPGETNIYVVTGDSGDGLTHGTIASLILPGLILAGEHPWAELYSPSRSRVHGFRTLLAEAMRDTAPYSDWLRAGDVASLDSIPAGHGATIRRGMHVIAAYRDLAGSCHLRNAKCTHLSGVVRWNDAEQTWDCPCHGSRFDPLGRVLNGPATQDLAEAPSDLEQPVREPAIADDLAPARLA
jgi:glycine/D-amino acid oxidase-like deaminating enzyme/nitrite reductase/ring-hydroxylating ferredoxin subunit